MLYKKYILFKLLLSSISINGAIQRNVPHDDSCASRIQSPININTSSVIPINFAPLQPKYFNTTATYFTMTNTGEKLKVTSVGTNYPQLSGGPLKGTYTFFESYFYWGENDTVGSEHTINYHRYPMEVHITFYNNKYGGSENAAKYGDGSLILAFFYKISKDDNEVLERYIKLLSKIQKANTNINISHPDSLASLATTPTKYYVYKGTLPIPKHPYYILVTWLVINDTINISSKQMAALRTLKDKKGKPIIHNYSQLKPLNWRNVYTNSDGSVVSPGMF